MPTTRTAVRTSPVVRRRRARLARLALGSAFFAANAAACQMILGIDDDRFHVAVVIEAGPGDPPVEAAVPETCVTAARPADRPEAGDTTELPEMIFAFTDIDLSGRRDGGEVGYDLDGVCTCDPNDRSLHGGAASCVPPAESLREGGCDLDGGVDNGMFEPLTLLSAFTQAQGNPPIVDPVRVACGEASALVMLSGYNGLADDPSVTVGVIPSFGIRTPHDGGERADAGACYRAGQLADAAPFPAKFDGTDEWSVLEGHLDSNRRPIRPLPGWVRGYQLVLDSRRTPSGGTNEIPFVFGNAISIVATPLLTAQIVPLDAAGNRLAIADGHPVDSAGVRVVAAHYRLEHGVLGGRMNLESVLRSIGTLSTGGVAKPHFCDDPLYPTAKALICRSADTLTQIERDFRGEPCDALSLAVQFDAVEAKIGTFYSPPPPTRGCAVNFTDNCPVGDR